MLYVDVKYAALVGGRIKNFKQKGQYVWQYTCPHCSDWSSEKPKARAYIYRKKTDLFTKCHHCGHGSNVGNLIKHFDEILYKQYVVERYQNNVSKFSDHKDIGALFQPSKVLTIPIEEELLDDVLAPLQRLDTLGDHPARKYIQDRKIPAEYEKLFYYAPEFKAYVNGIVKKFTNLENEHPRLIIPYFNRHGKVVHFNARAMDDREPKYMMIRLDDDAEKIYGLDRIDYAKKVYATEGEFDSLMLDNCVAVGGASSFMSPPMEALKSNLVLIHDNEPRSKEVTKIVAKTIQEGYNCFLPPENFPFKDLNQAIKEGMTREELKAIIDANCFQGLRAQLRFTTWKKC
jgi:hypothetical protein